MTEYVSKFDSRRRLRVLKATKTSISFEVDRKVINKQTGEIKIESRPRETTPELFAILIKAYDKV